LTPDLHSCSTACRNFNRKQQKLKLDAQQSLAVAHPAVTADLHSCSTAHRNFNRKQQKLETIKKGSHINMQTYAFQP